MRIAYLVNKYPAVSHTFIRSEILALEARGIALDRLAMRGWEGDLVDPLDLAERKKTRYVLRGGVAPLLLALGRVLLTRPGRFFSALATAWRLSRGAERGLIVHLIYLLEACLVLRWVEETGADHIHAHFGSNAAAVAMLVHKLGGPQYSFTIHGSEEFDKPYQWKLREKIADATFVVAVSSFCRAQVYRSTDFGQWSKIHIIHCTIDPRFEAIPATSPPANNTLVCVGRLCEQKGQLILVQAMAALQQRGVEFDLVLAGDGEMRPDIEQAVASAGLQNNVRITGWVTTEEIVAILEKARGMVLASFIEGLPVVIMEAMARRRPVISTCITGIPELVRDGIDGLLVPASDVDALAAAIEKFLAMSEEEMARMGQSASERAWTRHSAAIETAKLAALFEQYAPA